MVLSTLVFASALFLISHLGLSSTSSRQFLIERLGRNGYLIVYSVVAIVTLGFMMLSSVDRPGSPYLWVPSPVHWSVTYVLVATSFVLIVGAFTTTNPTSLGKEAGLAMEPRGFICITRHPFQWGLALWVLGHMVANWDVASLVFFGTYLIDMRMAREQDGIWPGFAASTSNLPLGAVVTGRAKLGWNDLWLPSLIGLVVYAVVFVGHGWITGAGLL